MSSAMQPPPAKAEASRAGFHPAVLCLAPLIYVAWSDGALTEAELEGLRSALGAGGGLPRSVLAEVDAWLDAASPPDPVRLRELLLIIHALSGALDEEDLSSLARLGHALGAIGSAPGAPEGIPLEVLEEVEAALGVHGGQAAHALLSELEPASEPAAPPAVSFDPAALYRYLDGDHLELRQEVLALLGEPRFRPPVEPERAEYRERVLAWLQELAGRGYGALPFPAEHGGADDLARAITVFETLAFHDLSLTVKFGVHFGLFGGSVLQLGTERHHRSWLKAIGTLELPGCFAMTETGHGSNVRDLETVASYDHDTDELVIHTPEESARKDYIGNAALHARMATVFAQLEVDGVGHGVHAVLVPIRDAEGNPMPGVRIEDCGPKEGLNGVDNGRLWFDHVRVPRENLLNRFGDIDAKGRYTSSIPSPGRRFFAMLSTLIAGRVSIAAASNGVGKLGLVIAVRYADRRRQFGPAGEPEIPILDYRSVQRRLITRLATVYGLDFALQDLVRQAAACGGQPDRELEVAAAGLKALGSRNAMDLLRECRETCGGQGYLAENRFSELLADTDVFTTFEGANPVLLQLVARGLLTEFREDMGEQRLWGVLRYLRARASLRFAELNPVAGRRTDPEHLLDPSFHEAAFQYRQDRHLIYVARGLKAAMDDGGDAFDAFNAVQIEAIGLGRAYAERLVLERFQAACDSAPEALRDVLGRLCAVYALSRIEDDAGWYLETGWIEPAKSRAIRAMVGELCLGLRSDAVGLVDAFGIPDAVVRAPIGIRGA